MLRCLVASIVLVTAALGGLLSCQPVADDAMASSHAKATREWHRHEKILEDSLKGPSDPDQLLESAIFFQKLTGISVRGDTFTFGFSPNRYTEQDLTALKQWYIINDGKLYWDEESRSVKLKERTNCSNGEGD